MAGLGSVLTEVELGVVAGLGVRGWREFLDDDFIAVGRHPMRLLVAHSAATSLPLRHVHHVRGVFWLAVEGGAPQHRLLAALHSHS